MEFLPVAGGPSSPFTLRVIVVDDSPLDRGGLAAIIPGPEIGLAVPSHVVKGLVASYVARPPWV